MVDNNDSGNGADDGSNASNDAAGSKNLQAEFYRKTEKLASEQAAINQKLEQIASMIATSTQSQQQRGQAPADQSEDLEALAYRDPKEYARKVKEMAAMEASRMIDARMSQQAQTNNVISQLGAEYPELADAGSDLTKRAVEIYKTLSAADQATPSAYKVAVRDAAAELGILPKAKRKSSDDFSLSGSSSEGMSRSGNQRGKEDVDVRTLAFAEAVGLNIKDKKTVDRIKQRATRKNWSKYE